MEAETSEFFDDLEKRDARTEIRLAVEHGITVRGLEGAKKYKPTLPSPPSKNPRRRISFVRDEGEIEEVSVHLYKEKSVTPSIVGEACFERILSEARR